MKKTQKSKRSSIASIQRFLVDNAESIQKLASNYHKRFLGKKYFRTENSEKYNKFHIQIINEFAKNIYTNDIKKGMKLFQNIGENLAQEAARDGLTIEETIDGTIFLKQAVWKKLEEDGLFDLTTKEYHEINMVIGTYCDIVSSKIAITYHKERQLFEGNLQYLVEASKILSSSLDYEKTLCTVAELAVPHIADWCTVDVFNDKGELKQVAVAHKDPKKVKWAQEFRKKQPIDLKSNTGISLVLSTGKPFLISEITDELLRTSIKDQKTYRLAKSLGFYSVMVVPIYIREKINGAISFISTEGKRHYNQADLNMAEELANRASLAIENAKLYKGSQEAITLRDEFITVASHELKTPVTSVKIFTQILKKHSEQIGDQKAVQHLSKMDLQISKLTELIYDLLNVSKIQAGKIEFRKEFFDFDKAVTEIVDILQQSETKHIIKIIGSTHKKIFADEERIGQVVNNLISNAFKYSPNSDKVVIRLKADKINVYVEVQDFGIGMEQEHLERIFERFYRIYGNPETSFSGLGIGLYISAEIIRRHNGKLWVESNPGKGSTFYFSLPIHDNEN